MDLPTIPPPDHPPSTLTAAQRRGLRYQRRVGEWLRGWVRGTLWDLHESPWLQGPYGPVQPDFVLTPALAPVAADGWVLLVLETKLTQCDCARQIANYKWALRDLGRIVAIQVCRRVLTPPTVRGLEAPADGHMLLWI